MSTCVRKCTFARACNVGANSLNVVSRTFPHIFQSMLTPMGLHKILTSSTFLKKLALMLDAFGEVCELSLALQSESTTLSKAYELVKRCIIALAQFKEGHSAHQDSR